MIYATPADMIARFGEREMAQLTDPALHAVPDPERLARALEDAQSVADAHVGRVWRLPLAGCAKPAPVPGDVHAVAWVAPPQLTRIVCDIARHALYDEVGRESVVRLRYEDAMAELKALADGRAVLTCPWGGSPGVQVAGDAPGEGEVLHGFAPRAMRDDDLRGFA